MEAVIGAIQMVLNMSHFSYCIVIEFCVHSLFFLDFQATVLQALAKISCEVRELKQNVERMSAALHRAGWDEDELVLPEGLILPMSTTAHMMAMEAALDDGIFSKRLVSNYELYRSLSFSGLLLTSGIAIGLFCSHNAYYVCLAFVRVIWKVSRYTQQHLN